jgi:hypothetical protein
MPYQHVLPFLGHRRTAAVRSDYSKSFSEIQILADRSQLAPHSAELLRLGGIPLTTIDGIWPDDNLVGGRRALRATIRTLGLAALANGLRLVHSAKYAELASFQKAPTTILAIIARVERGFADFAQIPYQDALTHRELSQLLDDLEAEHHTDQSAGNQDL